MIVFDEKKRSANDFHLDPCRYNEGIQINNEIRIKEVGHLGEHRDRSDSWLKDVVEGLLLYTEVSFMNSLHATHIPCMIDYLVIKPQYCYGPYSILCGIEIRANSAQRQPTFRLKQFFAMYNSYTFGHHIFPMVMG
jgi:hypothetical protein